MGGIRTLVVASRAVVPRGVAMHRGLGPNVMGVVHGLVLHIWLSVAVLMTPGREHVGVFELHLDDDVKVG